MSYHHLAGPWSLTIWTFSLKLGRFTCENYLPWSLSQGFLPCHYSRLRALVPLPKYPSYGPRPSLEAVLLPAEVNGQETCLLLHLQSLLLGTLTPIMLISINTGQTCCRMTLGKGLLLQAVRAVTASATMATFNRKPNQP